MSDHMVIGEPGETSEKKKRNVPHYKDLFQEAEEQLEALGFWVKGLGGLLFVSIVLNIILIVKIWG